MPDQTSLHDPRLFSGTLRVNDDEIPVSFQAQLDHSGAVRLELGDIPLNPETMFLRKVWESEDEFQLAGRSEDGTQFSTEHLFFTSTGTRFGEGLGTRLVLTASCRLARFRFHGAAPEAPTLLFWLQRFESIDQLRTSSRIGELVMHGSGDMTEPNVLSGYLAVKCQSPVTDEGAWHRDASNLLDHVRRVMSFALSVNLSAPVVEWRRGIDVEVTVRSGPDQGRSEMPVFHALDRQGIFECAVRSFYDPPRHVENLWMALEWFAMDATYNEVRLLNAMTALENIVNSNLADSDKLLLTAGEFTRLSKSLKEAIDKFVGEASHVSQDSTLASELREKFGELKRRSIKARVRRLITRWLIPMDGLDIELMDQAINARNLIVHEGRYYAEGKQQTDLWEHVTVTREFVVRAVLTVLGYRGRYISHVGGYHHASFPPEPSVVSA